LTEVELTNTVKYSLEIKKLELDIKKQELQNKKNQAKTAAKAKKK